MLDPSARAGRGGSAAASGSIRLLLATAALLAAGPACAGEAPAVPVVVTAKGCEPAELTVPAGHVTFIITNRSSRALEWEILKGVMIVDERENIAPGFRQKLTTTLQPGDYEVTCGLLSNPRGRLRVTGSEAAGAARPGAAELIGLAAEYRVWTLGALGEIERAAAAQDRAAIRAALLNLAPIEALAAPQAQALDQALASPSADLAAPAAAYAKAVRALSPSPRTLLAGLAAAARSLAQIDAGDALALLAGIEAPAAHLLPLVKRADAGLAAALERDLAALRAGLSASHGPLADVGAALAADLDKVSGALGLS